MRGVLDDELSTGSVTAELRLRPVRAAHVLNDADWDTAAATVQMCCQYWGGAADLLRPVHSDGEPHTGYKRLVADSEVDSIVGLSTAWAPPTVRHGQRRQMPTLMALATSEKDNLKTLESADAGVGDAWQLSYLATLGVLPESPDTQTLRDVDLNEELTFEQVVRFRRVEVSDPGVVDLLARLRSAESFTPVRATWHRLRRSPARINHSAIDGWLADEKAFSRQRGPSVVVVYKPRSVADLCLLWNLRALHGWLAGMPLGVPWVGSVDATVALVRAALDDGELVFGGSPALLVSSTLGTDLLAELAAASGSNTQTLDIAAATRCLFLQYRRAVPATSRCHCVTDQRRCPLEPTVTEPTSSSSTGS